MKAGLTESIASLKGVGQVSAQKMTLAGIETKLDLIEFVPYKYQQLNYYAQIKDIKPGEITIKAQADNVQTRRSQRRFVQLTTAELFDDSDRLMAVWFNQPYRARQLASGQYYFSGPFEFTRGQYQLTNPSVQAVTAASTKQLTRDFLRPIYSQIRGLKSGFISKIIANLSNDILLLPEILPEFVIKQAKLIGRADSYYYLHFPDSQKQLDSARRRQLLEKYFILSLSNYLARQQNDQLNFVKIDQQLDLVKQIVADLPFELTADQKKAIWQIMQNFDKSEKSLNCLLQGDVGSGKTIIAIIIAAVVAKNNHQVALMAPTEILAKQHYQSLTQILQKYDIKVTLLTSSTSKKEKQAIYEQIKSGQVDIVVGTHALIQSAVEFDSLALAIIDEQHRFGVLQRQELIKKASQRSLHLLSMTATPIPRSLALILKNELEVLSLKQKPAHQIARKTQIIGRSKRKQSYKFIKQQLYQGRQVYIVCGLIEPTEGSDRVSATELHQKLTKGEFKDYQVGLLHGQMKPEQKDQVLADFLAKKYDLLVTTTVIEVGVDVPNATVMMIEDANFFGLSQLHQLRGRIGRSEHQGYCFLVSSNSDDNERLNEITKSEDGFYLSEVDLKLRGAGNIFGSSQHGWFDLEADLEAIKEANQLVDDYIKHLNDNKLDIKKELQKQPLLSQKLAEFDSLTILN